MSCPPNTLHKLTSPRSLIKTAICALFAASAIRQKSCFAIEESCAPCTCPGAFCDDDGCACDVGGGGFRLWACCKKYCAGWFVDGDGKGAELDVADDGFREWQGGILVRAIIQRASAVASPLSLLRLRDSRWDGSYPGRPAVAALKKFRFDCCTKMSFFPALPSSGLVCVKEVSSLYFDAWDALSMQASTPLFFALAQAESKVKNQGSFTANTAYVAYRGNLGRSFSLHTHQQQYGVCEASRRRNATV